MPTYLAIGHFTRDRFSDGWAPGGAAWYGAIAASALGWTAAAVTHCLPQDATAPGVEVFNTPARRTIEFENVETANGRAQRVPEPLGYFEPQPPDGWKAPDVLHMAPVLRDFRPIASARFRAKLTIASVQGWMRAREPDGTVRRRYSPELFAGGHADAITLSIEDAGYDEDLAREIAASAPVGVITRGARGATLLAGGAERHIPARRVVAMDSTGAGDVFAASFGVALHEVGDPEEAAIRASTCSAAFLAAGFPGLRDVRGMLRAARPV